MRIDDVHHIELSTGELPVGPVNTYLLIGDKVTLVDTGPNYPENLNVLKEALAVWNITIFDIDQILLTG